MVIAKFNCNQALVTDGKGNFIVSETTSPWVQDAVEDSPPEDESPGNVFPIFTAGYYLSLLTEA